MSFNLTTSVNLNTVPISTATAVGLLGAFNASSATSSNSTLTTDEASIAFGDVNTSQKYLKFSVYPGILLSLFGTVYLGIQYSISLEIYILQIIIHALPLLWISHNTKSLTHNILISGLYLL